MAKQNHVRQSAVRQGDWKYLRTYKPVGSDKYQAVLYNLKKDLGETNDLAAKNPAKTKVLSDLLDQWEKQMSKTAEPMPAPSKRNRKKP